MTSTLESTVRMLNRKTGLRLDPGMGSMLFLAPARGPSGELQYGTLRVNFERGCHVVFQLTEDLPQPSIDKRALPHGPVTQNWIEMTIGYGDDHGFRRARLMRNGGVDLTSNGQPVFETDPHGRRGAGVPLRLASVYGRIREIGFTNAVQGRKPR